MAKSRWPNENGGIKLPFCTNNNAMHWTEKGLGPEICPLSIMSGFDMHISLSWRNIILNKMEGGGEFSALDHDGWYWRTLSGEWLKILNLWWRGLNDHNINTYHNYEHIKFERPRHMNLISRNLKEIFFEFPFMYACYICRLLELPAHKIPFAGDGARARASHTHFNARLQSLLSFFLAPNRSSIAG